MATTTKKTKQDKNSYSINEAEFKDTLKKIIQAPSLKTPQKKKARPKSRLAS
jgi:hypothetical protein